MKCRALRGLSAGAQLNQLCCDVIDRKNIDGRADCGRRFGHPGPTDDATRRLRLLASHRIHHSREIAHRDKNFAVYFPIWDVLFGTYYAPAREEFPATGIQGVTIRTLWEAASWPFIKWTRTC